MITVSVQLSDQMRVCLEIFKLSDPSNGSVPVTYNDLVESLKEEMSEDDVSLYLDRLFDLGMISGRWVDIDGKWERSFSVTGEATAYVRSAYNICVEEGSL